MKLLLLFSLAVLLAFAGCAAPLPNYPAGNDSNGTVAPNQSVNATPPYLPNGENGSSANPSSSPSLKFGVNAVSTDPAFQRIISEQADYSRLFAEYGISYVRYPGGIPVRYYLWDRPDLTDKAVLLMARYGEERGSKKADLLFEKADNLALSQSNYGDFLSFCKKSGATPIVQLNTISYADGNEVYPVEKYRASRIDWGLQQDRWVKIRANLARQLQFTHQYYDSVTWEIGNEDYYAYDAETYALIVSEYTRAIKDAYPQDKVMVSMANEISDKEYKAGWSDQLVSNLSASGVLWEIDYFAPHFYNAPSEVLQGDAQIKAKLLANKVVEFNGAMAAPFPQNYSVKFFYTEYSPVLKSYTNANYNTQLHALLMLNYLLRMSDEPEIYGLIHHGFTQSPSYLFGSAQFTAREDYVDKNRQDSPEFPYIPPQAKAVQLFFGTLGDKVLSFESDDGKALLVSEKGGKRVLQALNFDSAGISLDLSAYAGDKTVSYKIYSLNDLGSHYWDYEELEGSASGSLAIPPYSFAVAQEE